MRIGLFSWETKNSVSVGGVAEVVSNLGEALSELGHEVHTFTRIGANQPEHELTNGVMEHRCVSQGSDDFVEYMDGVCDSMAACLDYVEEEHGKLDVLHAHDWHVVNALANIKHNTGREFVWTCHSTEFGRNGNNHYDNWFSCRIRHREWLGGYLAKAVTTVSYGMRDEIGNEYNIPKEKVDVIYNGIKAGELSKPINAGRVKERYGIHPLAPVVLFVGRMCNQKGPDLLLEAVPHILSARGDAHFIFAGGGESMMDHIRGRAHWLGVGEKVHVLGYVSTEDKEDLLRACDLVCAPSRNEPFGIVTLEAWAAGKPVVASDVGGPREIIKNMENGIKVYPTPESIAWGIKELLCDPSGEKIRRMSENAKKSAAEYSWPEIAKKYVQVYERVC